MHQHTWKVIGATGLAAVLLGGGTAAAVGARNGPPPLPPGVTADGSVDASLLPDQMKVVGPDGRLVRDSSGRPITVDVQSAPPSGKPALRQPELKRPELKREATFLDGEGLVETVIVEPESPIG